MSKYRVGGKSENDNRVDSFIWLLGVNKIATLFRLDFVEIVCGKAESFCLYGGYMQDLQIRLPTLYNSFLPVGINSSACSLDLRPPVGSDINLYLIGACK